MSTRTRWTAGTALLPVLLAGFGAAPPVSAAGAQAAGAQSARSQAAAAQTAAAQKAADQWLALVDAGKYGESWDQAADIVKGSISRKDWISNVRVKRSALGKVVSRKLLKADALNNVAGAPPGHYVGLQYLTAFEKSKSTVEAVVPVQDKDGAWRVAEYVVQAMPPAPSSPPR